MTTKTQLAQATASSNESEEDDRGNLDIAGLFLDPFPLSSPLSTGEVRTGRQALIEAQREDEGLQTLMEQAQGQAPDAGPTTTYYFKNAVLCRRWLPPTYSQADAPWAAVEQIVVPSKYQQIIMEVGHDERLSGHLGTWKTLEKI
ncbi:hypothetical protein E2C01_094884 [Portunus trituberculatus]|uniref:Integrase zinc-binding domain-containing protein n=1 Tax=Portunus trituberculatus TaxID=210409 RepID=A0A5B7JRN6_PORTR|nr:hypothetical protein [Portunus trituberculatus]